MSNCILELTIALAWSNAISNRSLPQCLQMYFSFFDGSSTNIQMFTSFIRDNN